MPQQSITSGTDKLILLIKSAYWVALLIIAAMAMASYMLLQQMMAAQQHDETLLSLVSTQKALSQRVVFLASSVDDANVLAKPSLIASLKEATAEFEKNYDLLLDSTGADPASPAPQRSEHASKACFSPSRSISTISRSGSPPMAGASSRRPKRSFMPTSRRPAISPARNARGSTTPWPMPRSTATSRSATASMPSPRRGSSKMLSVHRTLFFATIGVIILVALFIFRPMSQVILRRTHELVDARNSMAFIAVHDGLTGLHNRTFLTDHFDTLIKGAHRRGERLAVLQLDLDRFKQINDTLGHAAGDYVLVITAQRMRDACRASDLCVRLGGDEFVMILSGAGTGEDINEVARRILSRINEPINFHGATIHPGASAGIAVYPLDADNAKDLIVHADLALYSAKKLGGGNCSFFSDELRQELDHRKQLERDLKIAIAERTFSVYYQPQVSLTNGVITGVEALVRWNHQQRGMISPGEFIPVAEKSGLMAADRPHHRGKGGRRGGRMAPGRHFVRTAGDQRLGHRIARTRFRPVPVRDAAALRPAAAEAVARNRRIRSSSTTRRPGSPPSCVTFAPKACISNSTISAPAMPRSATSIRTKSTG